MSYGRFRQTGDTGRMLEPSSTSPSTICARHGPLCKAWSSSVPSSFFRSKMKSCSRRLLLSSQCPMLIPPPCCKSMNATLLLLSRLSWHGSISLLSLCQFLLTFHVLSAIRSEHRLFFIFSLLSLPFSPPPTPAWHCTFCAAARASTAFARDAERARSWPFFAISAGSALAIASASASACIRVRCCSKRCKCCTTRASFNRLVDSVVVAAFPPAPTGNGKGNEVRSKSQRWNKVG